MTGATGSLIAFDVVHVEPGHLARAERTVSTTLEVFRDHFPRFPVLPGVVVLGSLAELGARLLDDVAGGPWQFVGASQSKFRRYVRPGDRVAFEVTVIELAAGSAVLMGQAQVDGRIVVEIRSLHFLRPAS